MNNKQVTIIDYGMGNILSLSRALAYCGASVVLTDSARKIEQADCLILPGVGAFGDGIKELEQRGIIPAIQSFIKKGKPFLGICLGMQMLFDFSVEFGRHDGLSLINGSVMPLPSSQADGTKNKIPHISWNQIYPFDKDQDLWHNTILENIKLGSYLYFLHSFHVQPLVQTDIIAITPFYDYNFPSVIARENIHGVQFHPEKSGPVGLSILKNFIALTENV